MAIDLIKRLRRRRPELWMVVMSAGRKTMPASLSLKLAEAFGADRVLYKTFRDAELLTALMAAPTG